jgi:hypothetical protein
MHAATEHRSLFSRTYLPMELAMKELVEAGGAGFLIPAVLFAIVLYAARGLFGLHDQKSKIRREFLELWDRARSQDDLWLEVAVRHWMGAYLPAHVIRLAFEQPDKSQSLIESYGRVGESAVADYRAL